MSRIASLFAAKKARIGYLTAGDAEADHFLDLVKGGIDLLEIGIPFSDPIADGPVIQRAMQRALAKGTTLATVFSLVRKIRAQTDVPIVLFTYYNPIQKNLALFLREAKRSGADGILVVDLPLEEAGEYPHLAKQCGLDPIFVIAPSTPVERIALLSQKGSGFLYYACRKGTTGARHQLPPDLPSKIGEIRSESSLPVAVGFGIADRLAVQEVLRLADGAVIGSYFVEAIEKNINLQQRVESCCSN